MLFSESEFRDPSDYPSFYYPPEGPDTEKEQSEAQEEAGEVIAEDAAAFQEALQQTYPGATVTAEVGDIDDEDIDEGRDYYHYTAYVNCTLHISIPREDFGEKTDDEIFDLISDICATEAALEVEWEDDENDDVTDTSVEISMSGRYKYYYENDKDYDGYDERDDYDPYY